ncbi:MAG: type II toxin-antitoxin system Phd/YefM family antitoxin [Desulfobulbaceae bacterium]|uniref:Antitoxin n=1 Tax=Candidatus Desulfobia pelagia TaxID=2841692 RepID=A0A8J6NGS7_9BACT|nr:type II toxin-antitoxin system Phd/YefM family antitoxin [Candidatus Desulfobia pelagia]
MEKSISKSKFKPQALKYFRQVQQTGQPLIITDHTKPVLKIIPYREDPMDAVKELRNSILRYEDPMEPVAENDWDMLK